ncbi:MAG: hypothetical protein WAK01_04990 [Methylocystis sp.]
MTTDHLAWLIPAWIIGAPLLLGLYEFATLKSRRERLHGSVASDRVYGGPAPDRGYGGPTTGAGRPV